MDPDSPQLQEYLRTLGWAEENVSVDEFIHRAYADILERKVDSLALTNIRNALASGVSRTSILKSLLMSEEYSKKITRAQRRLLDIRSMRPDLYTVMNNVPVFVEGEPSHMDWLERMILDNKYYEGPGVWGESINVDKRVMAEILAAFEPSRALDVGCSTGAVSACLQDLGVVGDGVDLSAYAVEKALPEIRDRVFNGDLMVFQTSSRYDLIYGLDVFEHLHPERLSQYILKLVELQTDESYLLCNIPAIGPDEVFGTVFPPYVEAWQDDLRASRRFKVLHVDAEGYPLHGHLIWAGAEWWVAQFTQIGLVRCQDIEHAVHKTYDAYMLNASPARRALFVFHKGPLNQGRHGSILKSFDHGQSSALAGMEF